MLPKIRKFPKRTLINHQCRYLSYRYPIPPTPLQTHIIQTLELELLLSSNPSNHKFFWPKTFNHQSSAESFIDAINNSINPPRAEHMDWNRKWSNSNNPLPGSSPDRPAFDHSIQLVHTFPSQHRLPFHCTGGQQIQARP